MGRQVTLDELRVELIDTCGKYAGMAAFEVIRDHLTAGDRLKIEHQPVLRPVVDPPDWRSTPSDVYKVGDPDPTPHDPPFCGARYGHPTGGPWCAWRPGHDDVHVSGDGQTILAVFVDDEIAGWHESAGKTPEELRSEAPPEPSESGPPPDTVLWRMADELREQVDNALTISDRELRMMARLLIAVAEKVEQ